MGSIVFRYRQSVRVLWRSDGLFLCKSGESGPDYIPDYILEINGQARQDHLTLFVLNISLYQKSTESQNLIMKSEI